LQKSKNITNKTKKQKNKKEEKKMKKRLLLPLVLILALVLSLTACFGKKIQSIEIKGGAPTEVLVGETPDFSGIKLGPIQLGNFINAVVNFLIIAICLFAVLKAINKLKKPAPEEPAAEPRLCPYCKSEIAEDATRCPHCTSQL
jgi:large conductance mechanosensitive channel